MFSLRRMKEFSKTKPRFVVYCTPSEIKSAKSRATAMGLKTGNQWVAALVRQALQTATK